MSTAARTADRGEPERILFEDPHIIGAMVGFTGVVISAMHG